MSEPLGTFQFSRPSAVASIPNRRRVKLLPTGVDLAAAAEQSVGVTQRLVSAVGEPVSINSTRSPSGIYTSDGSISVGDKVYGSASGKVGIGNTGEPIGVALSATDGADQNVEVLHVNLV